MMAHALCPARLVGSRDAASAAGGSSGGQRRHRLRIRATVASGDTRESLAAGTPTPATGVVMDKRGVLTAVSAPRDGRSEASRSASVRAASMAEYADLKRGLYLTTAKAGGLVTAYLAAAASPAAAGSCALGVGVAIAYLVALGDYVDRMGPGRAPAARPRGAAPLNALQWLLRLPLVYLQALAHPQLVVVIAAGAGAVAWNNAAGDGAPRVEYAWLLVGFLSYKLAVLDRTYQDNKRSILGVADGEAAGPRPTLTPLETVDDVLGTNSESKEAKD